MKRREPSPKPTSSGKLETFGGPFHHFESDFTQRPAVSKRPRKKAKNGKDKRKKPESKPASPSGLETFGGAYHRFESVFQPKPAAQSSHQQDAKKQRRGKGKGRKSA
jgi:hypothetical protein